MSLAVPYLLAAAGEAHPDARIDLAGRMLTAAELDRTTTAAADEWLRCGIEPGAVVPVPLDDPDDLLRALGALRVRLVVRPARPSAPVPTGSDGTAVRPGPVLSRSEGTAVPPGPAPSRSAADLAVCESQVWSRTPAVLLPDGIWLDQGALPGPVEVDVAERGRAFPLLGVLRQLTALGPA